MRPPSLLSLTLDSALLHIAHIADLSHLPNSHYIVNSSDRGRKLFTARKHVARWYDKISTRESWRQVIKMQREHPGTFE